MSARPVGRRVLHVDTERTWGGGQRQLVHLVEGLARRGWESWVAARPGTRLWSEVRALGVEVLALSPAFEWDPWAIARLRRLVRSVNPLIVHAHAAHALALAAAAAAGSASRLVASRRVAMPPARNPLSRWKYGRADLILAVSEHVRDVLLATGAAASRVRVVRSGVDLSQIPAAAAAELLRELGVDPGLPLVVMVSALAPPHKDPATFVRAVAVARAEVPLQALLIGDGPLRRSAARARDALGLRGVLVLAGHRDDAEALLGAADVAVLSSRDEGLGVTVLEAMRAGRAVVATAAGGVREIVRNGVDGLLVPVGDSEAMGRAIAGLLGDEARRTALGRAGAERVRGFAIEATVAVTAAAYEEMAGRCGGSARRTRNGARAIFTACVF